MMSMKLSSFLESMLPKSTDDLTEELSGMNNDSIGGLLGINHQNQDDNELIDFALDDINDMTYGRRIARCLSKYSWYNPQVNGRDNGTESESLSEPLLESQQQAEQLPELDKGWAFFEHFSLPRYIYRPEEGDNPKSLDRAEPGENDQRTKLYSPFWTPLDQMGDFGIGIGLYFSSLKYLAILTFIAGVLSIPTTVYYASPGYSGIQSGIKYALKGSAICTHTKWVPCPTCDESDFKGAELRLRTNEGTGVIEALKNECQAPPLTIGLVQYFTMIFIFFGFCYISQKQDKMQVIFDEDEQTAQDYSIHVHNPLSDGIDPEEYNTFFSQFGHVTCCTLCVDNDILVQALVERRGRYQQIKRKLPPNTPLDDNTLSKIAAEEERKNISFFRLINELILYPLGFYDLTGLNQRITVLNDKIRGLAQLSYSVTNVFITFETEKSQRDCLTALSTGKYYSSTNTKPKDMKTQYLFRNSYVLEVEEATEPSDVRWQSLNITLFGRLKVVGCTVFTWFVTLCLLSFLLKLLHDENALYSAIAISLFNFFFPFFCVIITNMEPHKTNTDLETSLFLKMGFFRWVNTAIIIDLLTPFSQRLSSQDVDSENAALIASVFAIYFSDLIIANLLDLADPFEQFNRHYFAPRAVDQDEMDLCFLGNSWRLTERYTNISKNVFLCFYYATIFPSGYFLCSLSIVIYYIVDKFAIMRIWKRAPALGPSIAQFNDKFVVPTAFLVLSVISSYWWSAFPMDNLCVDDAIYNITHYPSLSPAPTLSMYPAITSYSITSSYKPTAINVFSWKQPSPAFHELTLERNNTIAPLSSNHKHEPTLFISNNYFNPMISPSVLSIGFKATNKAVSKDANAHEEFNSFNPTMSPTSNSRHIIHDKTNYKYCNQNLLEMYVFPAQSDSTWMSDDQQTITNLFGWTSVAVLVIICLWYIRLMFDRISEFFESSYESCGDDMGISFSDVEARSTYIAQVLSPEFPYPLIICNCSDIDDELFDWESHKPYDYYNVTLDVIDILNVDNNSIELEKSVFSIVKHWPVIGNEDKEEFQNESQSEIVEDLAEHLKVLKAHHRT